MSSKVEHEALWCCCHCCCWWKEDECDRRPQSFWQEIKFHLVWYISREWPLAWCRCGIFLAELWSLGSIQMWKASGWNVIHYLLANVIEKVKIATILHIHVETTEITPKIPGSGFSKKKKANWENALKYMLKERGFKREEEYMHILYKSRKETKMKKKF